jgi:flavocytochrome c
MKRRSLIKAFLAAALPARAIAALPADWDVIVVGAGPAGLSAAIAARESGAARVLVLEKKAFAGGHCIKATGHVNALDPEGQAKTGRTDSEELFFRDTYEGGDRRADPALVRVLVKGSGDALKWLRSIGAEMTEIPTEAYTGMYPRGHLPTQGRNGLHYVQVLMRRARAAGVSVAFRTRARRIVMDGNAVGGVEVEGREKRVSILKARAVVLATGGYGADLALRTRESPFFDERFTTTYGGENPAADPATGDGIYMAEALGAQIRDLDAVMAIPLRGGRAVDYPGADLFLAPDGSRFTDETGRWGDVMADLLERGYSHFWVITDSRSRKGVLFQNKLEQKVVVRADSVEELARGLRLPAEKIRRALQDYNEMARSGRDPQFGRTNFKQTLETPPFYYGYEQFDIHYTCGGIAITPDAEVKRASGGVIGGLFAAGETTGGVHGNFRLGGNALTDAFVFGRIAGARAAEFARKRKD